MNGIVVAAALIVVRSTEHRLGGMSSAALPHAHTHTISGAVWCQCNGSGSHTAPFRHLMSVFPSCSMSFHCFEACHVPGNMLVGPSTASHDPVPHHLCPGIVSRFVGQISKLGCIPQL